MGKDEVGRLGRFVKSYGIGTAILASGNLENGLPRVSIIIEGEDEVRNFMLKIS